MSGGINRAEDDEQKTKRDRDSRQAWKDCRSEGQKNPSSEQVLVGVCSPVMCYDNSTDYPSAMSRSPEIRMARWPKSTFEPSVY